jgi:RimJ/RimL family protein N-acetyltransferase
MSLLAPTLHTARLRLRPFEDADANDLFALHSNAYVLRYWDAPPWSERVRSERFITACRQMAEEGTGARLAVDRVSDGAFIGWCGLNRWKSGLPQCIAGLLLRRCGVGPRLRHGGRARFAAVGIRHAGPQSRPG